MVLNFIFKPKGDKQKSLYLLVIIFAVSLLSVALSFPSYFDKAADFVNKKTGQNIPHFKNIPFSLGLDLQGGTHFVYQADLSQTPKSEQSSAMQGMRDVIERRVNLFGVSEPVVQVSQGDKLIVELAGIKDVAAAVKMIGETPYLEFKEERPETERQQILDMQQKGERMMEDPYYQHTQLTGKYLKNAELVFDQNTYQPVVNLYFNDEGAKLFEELTRKNIGKTVAIYLDGMPISAPKVNEAIGGGSAVISGKFTTEEAKQLSQRLKSGALPVPIKLVSQQTIDASLGKEDLNKSLKAGIYAFLTVCVFMILFYRIPGVLAVLALFVYTAISLAIFKLWPITLTLAGIAGVILSIGMAVDANILIFSRMREEYRQGKSSGEALSDGFKRAWPSIRDSNLSTLFTSIILYIFATSSIKGFAVTLAIGVLVSMFSAVFVTRLLLKMFSGTKLESFKFIWYK